MGERERARRAVERVQEDELLRGDLGDRAAAALVAWASERAAAAASAAGIGDAEAAARVGAIRRAARAAARSGETEPEGVVAAAERALAGRREERG